MKSQFAENHFAYFSMEIGLKTAIPTYSGGLGVLAGDTIRAAADIEVPMIGVTLLHRKGYFHQTLDETGKQKEAPVSWPVDDFLTLQEPKVTVLIEGRPVLVQCWRFDIEGSTGFKVPVYFLDTDVNGNAEEDRRLTDSLYGGDSRYRLCQETVLGVGGVKILRALGYDLIERFHMNEGHAALLVLELLDEKIRQGEKLSSHLVDMIKTTNVFTTHTPVEAGHDIFAMELAVQVLGQKNMEYLEACGVGNSLNMTKLALRCSHFNNGVAMKHGAVSRKMFPGYDIQAITNGVHLSRWLAPSFKNLFDKYFPYWRIDPMFLRHAIGLPKDEVWKAHQEAKSALIQYINRNTNAGFDRDVLTIGFARRATEYKRVALLFQDVGRLKAIVDRVGLLQVVFAGKAHPMDWIGKTLIEKIFDAKGVLKDSVNVTFIPNYDMAVGRLLTAGADVWLNTPRPPMEASGTSGMKAAINGIPSFSVLDGWWIEGCIEGVTGWAIGDIEDGDGKLTTTELDKKHVDSLYDKLENSVLPCFYNNRDRFIEIMRFAIALNGSYFNTQRMVQQYQRNAYSGHWIHEEFKNKPSDLTYALELQPQS